ncbi:MAG TPA: endonuclease/exonuclease/phosphatase family protein [Bacteroidales bacterium]|nr:endonuclease/exonuclease/phosphatase family protein [Bacteroidales bacterium]HSA44172.1 endonuclease/exonuclease/phosphatase family protein [Bacteroidales bacterium]
MTRQANPIYIFRSILTLILLYMVFLGYGQDIRVMTYNIRYDNPDDGPNAWTHRKEKLCGLILRELPDVAGIQEALYHQTTDLLKNLPAYELFGVGRDDGKQSGEYAAILYLREKYERLDGGHFWLSAAPDLPGSMGWDAACTRMVSWVRLRQQETGFTFFVFNTHFDHVGEKARIMSARLLKKMIKKIAKGERVILTGDFNCDIGSKAMKLLQRGKAGLKDSRRAANNVTGTPFTYTGFSTSGKPGNIIDHILVPEKAVVTDYFIPCDSQDGYYFSDHLPVVVKVIF